MANEKVNQTKMEVVLEGTITEFDVKYGKSEVKNPEHKMHGQMNPYMSIKGVVKFGEHDAESMRFEKFISQYKKDGNQDGRYQKLIDFANNVKPSKALKEGDVASVIRLRCEIKEEFYMKAGSLKEKSKIELGFVEDTKGNNKAEATIKGRIISIADEIKNDSETGRVIVNMFGIDFFSNAVKYQFIVDKDLAEPFKDSYEVGCTAEFYVDYKLHKGEEQIISGSGLGVQRVTEGKSYVEPILVGASSPVDSDDDNGINNEIAKVLLANRKKKMDEVKDKDEKTPETKRDGLSSKPKIETKKVEELRDEFPF